jgi:Flp pilus assembly protein CpaB
MFRRSPRALLLWTSAAAVAVVTALVVGGDLAALHRRARDLGPEVTIAVASRDLATGSTVAPGDLRERRVHRSQVPRGALRPREVRGRVVAVPVLRDDFVLDRNLAPRSRTGLDAVVPPGMRIVRIVVADDPERLRPGAAVDVLATFDTGAGAATVDDASSDPAVVVARGALVLAAEATDDAAGAGAGITLLVTENESLALAYATAAAVVSVALVPPEDARASLPR